jgi:hypothetical protein
MRRGSRLIASGLGLVLAGVSLVPVTTAASPRPPAPRGATMSSPESFTVGRKIQSQSRRAPFAVPFRPTVTDVAGFKSRRIQASRTPPSAAKPSAPATVTATAPTVLKNFNGAAQVSLEPADPSGAVGTTYFVETTNSALTIFSKSTGSVTSNVSLNSFFGYPISTACTVSCRIFDPRVIYDERYGRFIIVAEAYHESATSQRQFLAVSKTSNPTGSWWIYSWDVDTGNTGYFYDFPLVGYNVDTVILTMNVYQREGDRNAPYLGADVWGFPKSRAYNGMTLTRSAFFLSSSQYCCTVAPSITTSTDTNTNAFLLASRTQGNYLTLWRARALGTTDQTLVVRAYVPVANYTAPTRLAKQPGTTTALEDGDARFESMGVQSGGSLWQVHTINLGGYPAPKFYQINTATNAVYQSGYFYRSATSYDFRASISANRFSDAVVTWTATDPANGINPEMWVRGRVSGDTLGTLGAGTLLVQSGTFSSSSRWGDFSSVSMDPVAYTSCGSVSDRRFWAVGQDVINTTKWGTRIGQAGFC